MALYKRDHPFRMNVMEENFETRSCIEIFANDIKFETLLDDKASTFHWSHTQRMPSRAHIKYHRVENLLPTTLPHQHSMHRYDILTCR